MSNNDDYEVKAKADKKAPGTLAKVGFGLIAAAFIGVVGYPLIVPKSTTPIEVSDATEFQEDQTGGGFGHIPTNTQTPIAPAIDFSGVNSQIEQQRLEMEARNLELKNQVGALQSQLATIAAGSDENQRALAAQIAQAVSAANEENGKRLEESQAMLQRQLEALAEQNGLLERQLTAQRVEVGDAELARLAADRENAEQRRRQQELAERREEQQRLMALRVVSPSVVFDDKARSSGSDSGGTSLGRNPSNADRNRAFVENGAPTAEITSAEVIANPSKTVLQGTLIGATLENAVDSSLPGNVIATVNNSIYSFDGSQILIPSGSRVFGSYSSDIVLGQGRILVRWSRIVTPEGQSVEISAFGGDQQGRSGIAGHVNSRFGQRFGGAALISLIGAAPAIAADYYAADSEIASDTAESIGENFAGATDSVLSEYASLPPIITIEQGSQVSIMVDRDLEFY